MLVEGPWLQTDKICLLANTDFPVTIRTRRLKIEGPLSVKQTALSNMILEVHR